MKVQSLPKKMQTIAFFVNILVMRRYSFILYLNIYYNDDAESSNISFTTPPSQNLKLNIFYSRY